MFVLLLATMAAAIFANQWEQNQWQRVYFDPFVVSIPNDLRGSNQGGVAVYQSRGPRSLSLSIIAIRGTRPVALNEAWQAAYRQMAPGQAFSADVQRVSTAEVEGRYRVSWNHEMTNQPPSRHGILAVATGAGNYREYLFVHLTAAGPPDGETTMIMQQVLGSIQVNR